MPHKYWQGCHMAVTGLDYGVAAWRQPVRRTPSYIQRACQHIFHTIARSNGISLVPVMNENPAVELCSETDLDGELCSATVVNDVLCNKNISGG